MTEIQAILFDLGNTLSRSASLSKSLVDIANSPIVEKLHLSAHQLSTIGTEIEQQINLLYRTERLDQPDWQIVWKTGVKKCGVDFSASDVEELCRTHLTQFVKNCQLEPYSIPLLSGLRKTKVQLGLVSNVTGPGEIFDQDLSQKGLRPYFDAVVWSSRVGVRKPNPEIFEIILELLKLKPGKQIVMVGDNEMADILGGKQMGFTTIKIETERTGSGSVADFTVKGIELQSLFDTKFKWSTAG